MVRHCEQRDISKPFTAPTIRSRPSQAGHGRPERRRVDEQLSGAQCARPGPLLGMPRELSLKTLAEPDRATQPEIGAGAARVGRRVVDIAVLRPARLKL